MADLAQRVSGNVVEFIKSGTILNQGLIDMSQCVVSVNVSGADTYDIGAGTFNFPTTTGSDIAKKTIAYAGSTANTTPFLGTATFTSIGIDENGNLIQKPGKFFSLEEIYSGIDEDGISVPAITSRVCFLGGIIHTTGSITGYAPVGTLDASMSPSQYADKLKHPTSVLEGANFTLNTDLTFNFTKGVFDGIGVNRQSGFPHGATYPAQNPVTSFTYAWQTGPNTFGFSGGQTQIDPNQYNLNGSGAPSAIPGAGRYTIQYFMTSASTGSHFVIYGQEEFGTDINQALANTWKYLVNDVVNIPLRSLILRGALIVPDGATNLSVDAVYKPANKLGDMG